LALRFARWFWRFAALAGFDASLRSLVLSLRWLCRFASLAGFDASLAGFGAFVDVVVGLFNRKPLTSKLQVSVTSET